eukprot:4128471-Lingulodinium_polyedra.AAC.1
MPSPAGPPPAASSPPPSAAASPQPPRMTSAALSRLTRDSLRQECRRHGLSTCGLKANLVERLQSHLK